MPPSPLCLTHRQCAQDNVPGFGGDKAVAIIEKVSPLLYLSLCPHSLPLSPNGPLVKVRLTARMVAQELGKPIDEIFSSFDREPMAAASLGQARRAATSASRGWCGVHRATLKGGEEVAVKVQRAGLKELFDTDLKNLKVLVKLLDKFDPKSDGADRSYADIYDESAKPRMSKYDPLLKSGQRHMVLHSQVPTIYWEATTPRVLTMEFVRSFKLTDLKKVEEAGLDKELLATRAADSFLTQILKTGYFHCDPHPGNFCVNEAGDLVYYDCGMMNELQPNVAAGFKEACFAVFGGGPYISQIQLDAAGKRLVNALELMGVLAKGADRLSVEKLARYFIRTFKDIQIGKAAPNIKTTLGADLQALTEQQAKTTIPPLLLPPLPPSTPLPLLPPGRSFDGWRLFVGLHACGRVLSVDGIGKGLDPNFDIPKRAQPFINELTEARFTSSRLLIPPWTPPSPPPPHLTELLQSEALVRAFSALPISYLHSKDHHVMRHDYANQTSAFFDMLIVAVLIAVATGLNADDIDTAVSQPRKVAYLEETVRAIEQGNLKIRVRSIENEQALARLSLGQGVTNKLVLSSMFLNLGLSRVGAIPPLVYLTLAGVFGAQAGAGALSIKVFDKKAARYISKDFVSEVEDEA
ncbi:MAG: hypothetical protein SGPRY_006040 [Prymnesium sp.]